jgi:anti-sigma-K factor RskA
MSEPTHEHWRDELAAYLLGSLADDEAAEVERHIEGCRECREELRWLRPALEVLPESVEPLQPSADLRSRIMAEVEPDVRPEPAAPAAPKPRRTRFRLWALRPAVGLAATAVVGAGIIGYAVGGDDGSQSTTTTPTVSAMLERGSRTLELTSLEQPPPGKTYQAWVKVGPAIEPAARFRPDPTGAAHVRLPATLGQASVVMVTVEPRGGSLKPTTKPVVRIALN